MSNTTDNAPVTVLTTEENTEETVEKQSFVQKSRSFIKNHKKPAIAVGALVGLVGVAALTGRKTDTSSVPTEYSELESGVTNAEPEESEIPLSQEN